MLILMITMLLIRDLSPVLLVGGNADFDDNSIDDPASEVDHDDVIIPS